MPFREVHPEGITPLEMSEPDKAWLGCFIDSEGSVGLYKSYRHPWQENLPLLTLGNTSLGMMEKAARLIGKKVWAGELLPSGKRMYEIGLSHRKAATILLTILPYLIEKRPSAEKIVEHYKAKDRICVECGRNFIGSLKRKFCSRKCYNRKYQRELYRKKHSLVGVGFKGAV